MNSYISFGITLSIALIFNSVFIVYLVFWIVSRIKRDTALTNYLCAKEKTEAVTEKLSEQKGLIGQLEIEEGIAETAYMIRLKKEKVYGVVWFISLLLMLITMGLYAGYKITTHNSTSTPSTETASYAGSVSGNALLFELPDGSYVTEEDVYLGADGKYYLKPGVAEALGNGEN